MKRSDPSSMVVPSVAKKDIEFVIPPSFRPTPSQGGKPINQRITVSNNPFNNEQRREQIKQQQQRQQPEVKTQSKGWDFLATVLSASVSLKEGGSKIRSKEAPALLISTPSSSSSFLDIPTMKTARSASLTVNSLGIPVNPNFGSESGRNSNSNSKRGSKIGINMLGQNDNGILGGRRLSKTNLFGGNNNLNPTNEVRRPSVSVEPNPECFTQFGGINPSLYLNPETYDEKEVFPDNHLGRVYYSVYYDYISEELTVTIQRIKNLPKSTLESGITNKTFMKICLLPDERSERKMSPRNENTFADLNPEFFETVVFPVSIVGVTSRTLRLLVFNIDVNRKHRGLGQSLLDIKDVNLTHGKLNLNADLQRFINSSEQPEILLSICYNSTLSKLIVNVVEGRFFKGISDDTLPDVFIKISLMQHTKEKKSKRTEVVKKSGYPQYQESLSFRLEEHELETCGIKVSSMQKLSFPEKDRILGTCALGGCMFARGKGVEHWEEIKKNPKVYIQMWHILQSETSDKNDNNKLSVNKSRSRSNSGALNIPQNFDPKQRRNSAIAAGLRQ